MQTITQVPDGSYCQPEKREPTYYRSKSFKCANRIPFVRKVPHQRAIQALKLAGLTPLKMDRKTTPGQIPWNNYGHATHYYHVHYCVSEGEFLMFSKRHHITHTLTLTRMRMCVYVPVRCVCVSVCVIVRVCECNTIQSFSLTVGVPTHPRLPIW